MNLIPRFNEADRLLHYRQPAQFWTEALPIGNGSFGAMIWGKTDEELLQLNHDTLWSGYPTDWNNPQARQILPKVRERLAARDFASATDLTCEMQGPFTASYQPLADVLLKITPEDEKQPAKSAVHITDYRRWLDLGEAISGVRWSQEDRTYKREFFASFPAQAIVGRMVADVPGSLNLTITQSSPLASWKTDVDLVSAGVARIHCAGVAPEQVPHDPKQPVYYDDPDRTKALRWISTLEVRLTGPLNDLSRLAEAADPDGGFISMKKDGATLIVTGATEIELRLVALTSFGLDAPLPTQAGLIRAQAEQRLRHLAEHTYADLRTEHIADYRALFDRVDLRLEGAADPNASDPQHPGLRQSELPTDQRIAQPGGADPGLVELLFAFGRYLLIASSRPGSQPANLQGIWNAEPRPPWNSNYTININTEMNYWPAESCALSECAEPLFAMIADLARHGAETATINYGCRGWVAHHNTDLWRQTAPVGDFGAGDPVWAMWPMGGVWLSLHLWEHWLYSEDPDFLRDRAWPLLRGACDFCLDWLYADADGRLITGPSTSPEHNFRHDGALQSVSAACAMDLQLIRELLLACAAAAELLGEPSYQERCKDALARLAPLRIGSDGRLMEWSEEFEDQDPHHRHLSHLLGVYPGTTITPEATPDLWQAAQRSLDVRGDEATGWGMGWRACLWARFGDGGRAASILDRMLIPAPQNTVNYKTGGIYPNLFSAHPPFQIDGNFAVPAAIALMLVYAQDGVVALLPALPGRWPNGSVRGLRVRGGLTLNLTWQDGSLQEARLESTTGTSFAIRLPQTEDPRKWRVFNDSGRRISTKVTDGLLTIPAAQEPMRYQLMKR